MILVAESTAPTRAYAVAKLSPSCSSRSRPRHSRWS